MEFSSGRCGGLRRKCTLSGQRVATGRFLQSRDDRGRRYGIVDAPAQARLAVALARYRNGTSRCGNDPLLSVVDSNSSFRTCLRRDGLPPSGCTQSRLAANRSQNRFLGWRHDGFAVGSYPPVVGRGFTLVASRAAGFSAMAHPYDATYEKAISRRAAVGGGARLGRAADGWQDPPISGANCLSPQPPNRAQVTPDRAQRP